MQQASQTHMEEADGSGEDLSNPLNWIDRIDASVVTRLPYAFCKRHNVVAVTGDVNGYQVVCVTTPSINVFSEMRRRLEGPVKLHEMAQAGFEHLLRQAFDKGQSAATQMVSDLDGDIDLDLLASEVPVTTDLLEESDQAPVVKLINALLTQAIREKASRCAS